LLVEETAGPSTSLRSGRDDNFVAEEMTVFPWKIITIVITTLSSRLPRFAVGPERSEVEGSAVSFLVHAS
jgi:hypothetical protein